MQMLGRFRSADGKNDFSSAGFHQTQLNGEIEPEGLRDLDDRRDQLDAAKNARPLDPSQPPSDGTRCSGSRTGNFPETDLGTRIDPGTRPTARGGVVGFLETHPLLLAEQFADQGTPYRKKPSESNRAAGGRRREDPKPSPARSIASTARRWFPVRFPRSWDCGGAILSHIMERIK